MALRLGFIGIVTQDLAASLAFYRDLGVPIPDDVDPASPHVDAHLEDGTALAWDTVDTIRGFDPSYEPATGGHRIALAFDQETPAAVDTTYAAMVAAGHTGHIAPWDAFWGQRYATLLDPDGNSVELFALLAPTS
ncbi:VOC family protein [Pimelobacter simplex]|uniref:VOC family protein n=1 Tax=Nocardioides simplex TaxID=2045 RepID=UPI0038128F75